MKGKLICIYGINNIGKSTQAKLLVEFLKSNGHKAVYLKYPIYALEPSGPFINSVLRGNGGQKISEEELQMWYTVNRFQYQPELTKFLEQGTIVIAEDYIGTGLAWGSTKGAGLAWLETINKPLIHEDFAVLLDGERFSSGKEANHIHESNDQLVARCRQIHLELAKKYSWPVVNANGEIAVIAKELAELVLPAL